MKKLKIKAVLIQLFGLLFFINGIFQLKVFSVFDKFDCAFESLSYQTTHCWDKLYAKENVFDYISSIMFWKLYGLLIGLILIALINRKNKISVINTFASAILTYVVFFFLFEPFLSTKFNDFGFLFSSSFQTRYLIGGITFTLIGIVILLISVNQISIYLKKLL